MDRMWSNKSLEPTPVGRSSSAFAVHVTGPAWLSSGRSATSARWFDREIFLTADFADFADFFIRAIRVIRG